MSNPWLSILIPVYNVEPWLRDCLQSVISQVPTAVDAQDGIEIIVVEDCSTDHSLALLQQLIDESPCPIHLLRHPVNRGLSAARNTLLEAAKGEYLWFLDSDDALHPGAIAELHQLVSAHVPDLVMCDFSVLRDHQQPKHRWRGENHVTTFAGVKQTLCHEPMVLFEGIYRARNLHIWSKVSRRVLWGSDLRFPEGKVMEDMVVTPRLALRAASFFYQPSVWVAYRQREGSILSTFSQKKIDDMSQACGGILELWLMKYPQLPRRARFEFCYFCVKTHICIMRNLRSLNHADLTLYRQRFFEHIQWGKTALCWEYIKRGWFIRLNRFIYEH